MFQDCQGLRICGVVIVPYCIICQNYCTYPSLSLTSNILGLCLLLSMLSIHYLCWESCLMPLLFPSSSPLSLSISGTLLPQVVFPYPYLGHFYVPHIRLSSSYQNNALVHYPP
uniref:Uncharacterized protein n=1 Tax=Cacopsylla melanoneura TaxID=428564 RepID=A0A8D8R1S2_9HEMI